MVHRASRPATLIAGRRLLDNPKAAFRFISGLVLALFITSAAIGALSSISALSRTGGGSIETDTLAVPLCGLQTTSCPASAQVASVSSRTLGELRATPGTSGVTVVHESPQAPLRNSFGGPRHDGPSQSVLSNSFGIVSCDQLAQTPAIGKCAPGAVTASVGYFLSNVLGHNSHASSTVWPSADISEAQLASLPVDAVVVATDGSSGSIERARTSLEHALPFLGTPVAIDALTPSTARLLAAIQDMTAAVIVASMIIAACSLAVSVTAGLGERKRPFSLLRLTGVPLGMLRRVITLESALPLLVVAAVSLVVGLLAAALYLNSQVGIAFQVPGITFWAAVLGGLAASFAIIASTFPLLNRITGPEVARND
jgi:hypothetical protein